jgi:CheY-like chemotaxis protein
MTDIQKQRAFEPFFTTKPVGKGTGLGLATCYGIARQHGGAMRLASTVGEGTTITLLLPRAPAVDPDAPSSGLEKARRSTRHLNSAPPSPKAEISLLLVEDEDAVRRAFTRQLRDAGYRVVAAASGEEALEYVAKEDFAIVVTDVVMPGVGGRVVVERLQARSPNARVIFMSGYVDDEVFQREGIPADACFLQKPFPAAVLLRAIRDQLADD